MIFRTFAIILGAISLTVWGHDKFFRRDYTYVDQYDAFYKLHSADARSWEEAFLTCDDEGAKFFFPEVDEEWRVAANLTESLIDVEDIFIGIRDEFGRGDFLTIDGYVYSKVANKCFKVNERLKTWDEAMHTCSMEGAILSTAILQINENTLKRVIDINKDYFIGVRRILPDEAFYTTQGSKIHISGEDRYNCGTVSLNGRNNDYNSDVTFILTKSKDCNETLPFICEMNLNVF